MKRTVIEYCLTKEDANNIEKRLKDCYTTVKLIQSPYIKDEGLYKWDCIFNFIDLLTMEDI